MLFTSYEFIGFVAVLLLAYYIIPQKFQWMLLLAFSCIFYYVANPIYLLYIFTTIISTYLIACKMEKHSDKQSICKDMTREEKKAFKKQQKKIRLRWLVGCLILNIGILIAVKYLNFILENVNAVLYATGFAKTDQPFFVSLALPMGISFYTFQAIGYLVDVYRGTIHAEKNPFKLALFISFFPQLIQGPISRFGDLAKTLYTPHAFDGKVVSFGLQRVLWGYFKKLVVADRLLAGVTTIISDIDTYNGAYAFVGMLFYTVQLYADFTGGIDITIGIAQALGITVQENFRRPYFSKSLKEYWRRWHISMCNWFRDYIFYPVSSSKALINFSKFSRKHFGDAIGKRLPVYISSFIVWFTTGIWHGASWNFIVWGLANFVVLMISQELEPLYAKFHNRFHLENKFIYRLFQVGRTFILVCCLNMFDCYSSVADTFRAFTSMLCASNWQILWNGELLQLGLSLLDYGILAVAIIILISVSLAQRKGMVREQIASRPYPVRFAIWFGMFLMILLMGAYGVGYDSSQFIYNRF